MRLDKTAFLFQAAKIVALYTFKYELNISLAVNVLLVLIHISLILKFYQDANVSFFINLKMYLIVKILNESYFTFYFGFLIFNTKTEQYKDTYMDVIYILVNLFQITITKIE